jgi:hypothetical protein
MNYNRFGSRGQRCGFLHVPSDSIDGRSMGTPRGVQAKPDAYRAAMEDDLPTVGELADQRRQQWKADYAIVLSASATACSTGKARPAAQATANAGVSICVRSIATSR